MESKTLTGMVWPDKGQPAYYCVIREKVEPKEKSFDDKEPVLEVLQEGLVEDYSFLKDLKKQKCSNIYTTIEQKYNSYMKDFNRYKRENSIDVRLRQSDSSSFEAAILKVKEFIKNKRIEFKDDSLIKMQLTVFSKETLLDPLQAYAVRSLCMVIGQFKKSIKTETSKEYDHKAWW